jgi:XdhC and CoxI family
MDVNRSTHSELTGSHQLWKLAELAVFSGGQKLQSMKHWRAGTKGAVLATVVHVEGSVYRRPGARALASARAYSEMQGHHRVEMNKTLSR